jgi:hypothetical protein
MGLSTEQLNARKAGQTAESNGFGAQEKPLRQGGVYQLKDSQGNVVDEQIVKVHPKFGDSQAAAFERVGYKFLRAAKPGEVKEIEVDAKHLATENQNGGQDGDETMKGIQARLSMLEKENADLKAGKTAEENKGASDDNVKAQAKEEAKAEGEARVEARAETEDNLRASRGAEETQLAEEKKEQNSTPNKGGSDAKTSSNSKKESK